MYDDFMIKHQIHVKNQWNECCCWSPSRFFQLKKKTWKLQGHTPQNDHQSTNQLIFNQAFLFSKLFTTLSLVVFQSSCNSKYRLVVSISYLSYVGCGAKTISWISLPLAEIKSLGLEHLNSIHCPSIIFFQASTPGIGTRFPPFTFNTNSPSGVFTSKSSPLMAKPFSSKTKARSSWINEWLGWFEVESQITDTIQWPFSDPYSKGHYLGCSSRMPRESESGIL